jgi:hypothetical protein
MIGPEDQAAAGRDRVRAGHADREQVIEALKTAFVDGRLTRDELDVRAGRALAARTYADLAALTADFPHAPAEPAAPAPAGPARPPAPASRRPLARAAGQSGICLIIAAAAVRVGVLFDPDGPGPNPSHSWVKPFLLIAMFAFLAALGFLGNGLAASAERRHSRRQLPPGPGPGGHALGGERRGGTGQDPVSPDSRTDQTRADLRAHSHDCTGSTFSPGRAGHRVALGRRQAWYDAGRTSIGTGASPVVRNELYVLTRTRFQRTAGPRTGSQRTRGKPVLRTPDSNGT